jgi:hypothetical protein
MQSRNEKGNDPHSLSLHISPKLPIRPWAWHARLDKKDYFTLRQLGKDPPVSVFQIEPGAFPKLLRVV